MDLVIPTSSEIAHRAKYLNLNTTFGEIFLGYINFALLNRVGSEFIASFIS